MVPSEAFKTNLWILNTNIVPKIFYDALFTPKWVKIPLTMGSL
jgi:hypothetical protein